MDINKKIKHYKLLTPTPDFVKRVTNSGASVLHARLVYSWLAYRSRHGLGASTRSLCGEVGLHPATVKKAVASLGDLVKRRGKEWVAVEPPEGLFVGRACEEPLKHWFDRLAYSVLYLPRKGAKVVYPETQLRFGLSHALVWSYIVRSAKKGGVMPRFTVAGTAALFHLDEKTVRSVVGDLVWLRLVRRVDLGSSSEMTPLPLTEEHLALFEPKPEAVRKEVEPVAKTPRSAPASYRLLGDRWDQARQACRGLMPQERAEEMFGMARRLGDSPDDFITELERVKAIYDGRVVEGKVAGGNLGGYLRACYRKRLDTLEEREQNEREERRIRDLLSSPEYQRKLAAEKKAAEADPLHPMFRMSDEAVFDRVSLGDSPVLAQRTLNNLETKLYRHVRAFVAGKKLHPQEEMDLSGDLRGKIQKHALVALNRHYKQPVLATQEEYERAIDGAIAKAVPGMPPLFGGSS